MLIGLLCEPLVYVLICCSRLLLVPLDIFRVRIVLILALFLLLTFLLCILHHLILRRLFKLTPPTLVALACRLLLLIVALGVRVPEGCRRRLIVVILGISQKLAELLLEERV